MARPSIPDKEKRQIVGLRLHPTTLQQLDEIVEFFKALRHTNPMLPFGYPQSRTEVIEFLLREGIRDVVDHVLAWNRVGTTRETRADLDRLGQSHFWNTLLTSVRLEEETVPGAWRDQEWSTRVSGQPTPPKSRGPKGETSSSKARRKPPLT